MRLLRIIPLALLIALVASPAQAWMTTAICGGGVPVVDCTSLTVDMWQDFEFDAAAGHVGDSTYLPDNDHCSSGTWAVSDANSVLSISTSGSRTFTKCPGGVTDNGTRGLAYDHTGNYVAYIEYTKASVSSPVSVGFWVKLPATIPTWCYSYSILTMNSIGLSVAVGRNDQSAYMQLQASTNGTAVSVTAGSWYWVTVQANGGDSYISIYDSSLNSLITNDHASSSGNSVNVIRVGATANSSSSIAGVTYIDNLVINWADGSFPITP